MMHTLIVRFLWSAVLPLRVSDLRDRYETRQCERPFEEVAEAHHSKPGGRVCHSFFM